MIIPKNKIILSIVLLLNLFCLPKKAIALESKPHEEMLEGEVVQILQHGQETFMDEMVPFQELLIQITRGSIQGESIEIKNTSINGSVSSVDYSEYKMGENVRIYSSTDYEGNPTFSITGRVKRQGLISLGLLFVIFVLLVGRKWGLLSLLGLGISFLIIFKIIIPLMINGANPVFAAILGSIIIIPTTFYISHGFNLKTHIGVIATTIALIFTGLLAVYFVEATHLTGFSSEEAGFLQVEQEGNIDIRGLLIAGIIIGVLGILDDVTIGQASVVQQIQKSKKNSSFVELFQNGMEVGQDHISSMVNTLVLVYAGSALPLLLLFFNADRGFLDIIELELISEEIIRMLVGSIGLVLAAPLATAMAAYFFSRNLKD